MSLTEQQLPPFVRELLSDRRLSFLFDDRLLNHTDLKCYERLSRIVERLLTLSSVDVPTAIENYLEYARQFTLALERFEAEGKYATPRSVPAVPTAVYDVTLLLSAVLTRPIER